jgi:lipoprotein NlpI
MGVVNRERGDFKSAKQNYQQALKIDTHYAKAHLNLGILADLYLQDYALALDHFEQYQALQKTPDKRVKGWITDLERRVERNKPVATFTSQ